jgi:hypothetical protein
MARREKDAEIALRHPDIRGTVAAYNKLFSSIQELDSLPTDLLQVLARQISDEYEGRTGPLSDFIKCYLRYLHKEPLPEARARDRMLRFGIPMLEEHRLPPKDEGED